MPIRWPGFHIQFLKVFACIGFACFIGMQAKAQCVPTVQVSAICVAVGDTIILSTGNVGCAHSNAVFKHFWRGNLLSVETLATSGDTILLGDSLPGQSIFQVLAYDSASGLIDSVETVVWQRTGALYANVAPDTVCLGDSVFLLPVLDSAYAFGVDSNLLITQMGGQFDTLLLEKGTAFLLLTANNSDTAISYIHYRVQPQNSPACVADSGVVVVVPPPTLSLTHHALTTCTDSFFVHEPFEVRFGLLKHIVRKRKGIVDTLNVLQNLFINDTLLAPDSVVYIVEVAGRCGTVHDSVTVKVPAFHNYAGLPVVNVACNGDEGGLFFDSIPAGSHFALATDSGVTDVDLSWGYVFDTATGFLRVKPINLGQFRRRIHIDILLPNGHCGLGLSRFIYVNPSPNVQLSDSGIKTFCGIKQVTHADVAIHNPDTLLRYDWYLTTLAGTMTLASHSTSFPAFNLNLGDTAKLVCIAKTDTNCTEMAKDSIWFLSMQQPVASIVDTNQTQCFPFLANYSASGGQTHRWYTDSAFSVVRDTAQTFALLLQNSSLRDTTYFIGLIEENAAGCSDTTSIGRLIPAEPRIIHLPKDTAICSGSNLQLILQANMVGASISWTVFANASLTGASAGIGNLLNNTLSTTALGADTAFYIFTASKNSCDGPPDTLRVFVLPPFSSSIQGPDTVCSGETFVVSLGSVPNGSYRIDALNSGNGFVLGDSSIAAQNLVQTLQNIDTLPQAIRYVGMANAGSCSGNRDTVSVVVLPTPKNQIAPLQRICQGTLADTLWGSNTSVAGFSSYLWLQSANANGPFVPANGNATNASYFPGILTASTFFKRVVSSTFGMCEDTSNLSQVQVFSPLQTNSISNDQNICRGDVLQLLNGPLLPTSATIQWQRSADLGTTWADLFGATLATYQPTFVPGDLPLPGSAPKVFLFRRMAYAGVCSLASNVVTIQINPRPVKDLYLITPQDTLCAGSQGVYVAVPSVPNTQFEWRSDPPAALLSGQNTPVACFDVPFGASSFAVWVVEKSGLSGCKTRFDNVDIELSGANMPAPAQVVLLPGNVLAYSDTASSFQWGYDDLQQGGLPVTLPGEIGPTYVPGVFFDPINRVYWVELELMGCVTKAYYNRPNKVPTNVHSVVETASALQVLAVPNPSNGRPVFWLQGGWQGSMNLQMQDLSGRGIGTTQTLEKSGGLRVLEWPTELPAGMYLLFVQGAFGSTTCKVLVMPGQSR